SRSCAPKVYPFALLPQNSIAQSALFIATSKKLKRIKPLRLKHFSPLYVTNSYQFFSANKLFVSRFLPHCFTQKSLKRLRSEEHTSELQSRFVLVWLLLLQ